MDKEKMININASLVEEPMYSSFEKDGEEVKVANFTLVKKYGGGKEYTKCSVYGEKSEMARNFKKGDLIHVFGYFKERAKENKVFKNFIVKSLNKTPNKNRNKNKNENNKEEK